MSEPPAAELDPSLLEEATGGICILTMNRPKALNAIDSELKVRLAEAVRRFEDDDRLGVLILTGSACGAFSVGSDIKDSAAEFDGKPRTDAPPYSHTMAACSKPVIAAIDGYCVGGGLEMALACDIRIATEASTFGLPEPRIGTLGNFGLDSLSRTVPLGEALLIHLTGDRVPAARAYQVGLIQDLLTDRTALFARAHQIATSVLSCSPTAVRTIKRLVKRGRDLPMEYAGLWSQPYRDTVHFSPEAAEGARAFRDKRPPSWQQRYQDH
jgi:enoyl-CoA hydratase/carnithine racemase